MGILGRIASLFHGFNWLIIPASFVAIIFHEISHGYAAYLMGDKTAKNRGRLTVNPINHMDPIGLLCMIVFGFGWAKPVPINPYYFKHRKLGISIVSLAGPISNLIMASISMIALMTIGVIETNNFVLASAMNLLFEFFRILTVLNISLAVFNLIPIPPLDGSKILFSVLPDRVYGFVLKYERYGFVLLIILLNLPFFSDFLYFLQQNIFNGIFNLLSMILF